MKYIGLLTSAASGKMGGIVASHNRNGSYFRRHTIPKQPRTPLQTKYRAQLAALSSQFKNLSAAQVTLWNAMAATIVLKSKLGTTYNPTGQQLFVSCNKHLQSVGITTILQNPTTAPTFASITTFTAAPAYTGGMVSNWTLSTTPNPLTSLYLVVRATAATSTGKSFVGKSAYRTLGYTNTGTGTIAVSTDFLGNTPANVLAAWVEMFGGMPVTGNVNFEVRYIDPVSGFASSPVRTSTTFSNIGFTVTPSNKAVSLPGTGANVTIPFTSAQVGNFQGTVAWTCSAAQDSTKLTGTITTASSTVPGSNTLTVTTGAGAGAGPFTVNIIGTCGALVVTTPIAVTVY